MLTFILLFFRESPILLVGSIVHYYTYILVHEEPVAPSVLESRSKVFWRLSGLYSRYKPNNKRLITGDYTHVDIIAFILRIIILHFFKECLDTLESLVYD